MIGDPSQITVSWRSALMFSVCLPIVIAAVFLLMRDVERKATIWLSAFLFAAVISVVPQIIGFANFYDVWPGLTFAPFNMELFLGPLLYLHADRLMRGGALGWRKRLLAPGVLQSLYYVWAFLFLGDYKSKWAYNNAVHEPYLVPLESAATIGLMLWALFAIRRLQREYRSFLRQTQSAPYDFEPDWLNRLFWVLTPALILYGGLEFISVFVTPLSYVQAFPVLVAVMIFLAWLSFDALVRLHTPFPKMTEQEARATAEPSGKDWAAEGKALQSKLAAEEWFLEPKLSIADVARRMGTNERYVSSALNQGLGHPFSELVNSYRIEKAKEALKKSDDAIIDIALQSGFNSKATFNRVFKDATGVTPSGYRKSQIQKNSENIGD